MQTNNIKVTKGKCLHDLDYINQPLYYISLTANRSLIHKRLNNCQCKQYIGRYRSSTYSLLSSSRRADTGRRSFSLRVPV